MGNCNDKIGCGITCNCNNILRKSKIGIKRYSIFTPPYGKGRIEEDENGDLCKFEDVKEFLGQN